MRCEAEPIGWTNTGEKNQMDSRNDQNFPSQSEEREEEGDPEVCPTGLVE